MINGTLNQENSMLARQAADIAEEIPKSITATEYMGIGSALANSNIYDRALKMYQIGVTISNNADDEVSLRRALASLLFATGSVEKGRQQYRMALDVFSKYDNNNLYHIEYTNTHTEMSWAFSELAIRQCNYASTHIVDSRRHLSQMAAGPFTDQIASQVASAEDNIRKCVP